MQLVARVQLCVAFSQRSDELGLQLTTLCFCGDLISGMPFRPTVSILSTLLFLIRVTVALSSVVSLSRILEASN
jgi:hypothetical protein